MIIVVDKLLIHELVYIFVELILWSSYLLILFKLFKFL